MNGEEGVKEEEIDSLKKNNMKIVKTYFKMVTYILFIIIIINCDESISNRQSKELLNKVKSSHDTMLQKPFVLDSAQLISN